MYKTLIFTLALSVCSAAAEVHTITLDEAIGLAMKQNPDILLSRLDQRKASEAIRIAKDPFVPKVYSGSGLAYTYGYPNSIEGNAPSIFQVRTEMAVYNRPKRFALAEARENARGALIGSRAKDDAVIYQTASLFLDAAEVTRNLDFATREADTLDKVNQSVHALVQEGRQLPVNGKESDLALARAQQRVGDLGASQEYLEQALADVLGFPSGDRVRAQPPSESLQAELSKYLPENEDRAVTEALANSREVKQLESQLLAKELEVRSQTSSRVPQVDLVAQYSLFAKYAYANFFQKFQRNNAQIGFSVTLPLLVGSAPSAQASQAELDLAKLHIQVNETRSRIALNTRKGYRDLHRAEAARNVAKLDLEVARDQLSVLLAQSDEGKASESQLNQARVSEQSKWLAFYDSEHNLERARLNMLHQTGDLVAALIK